VAKILIVDDEGDLRTLLGLCFLRAGHAIVVANDGAAGLACVVAHAPDLLITDLNMPVLDGLALLRRLRADGHAALPVIVLTACADQQTAARAAGADAFLAKPVVLSALVATAERLLAGGHDVA
jgi:two-component system chemotaxis response regulator CheY